MANAPKRCPRCQVEIPSDAEFCPECGAKLTVVCASCGTANLGGHKFCKKCGQPLVGSPVPQPKFGSPESYTPKHLAEKILTSRSALEGERKQVTVLFADMKGSMELLADRDPEEARKLLDPVLERMMEAVHHYEGTVNQVMGDGIMALFGAPIGHEDHAVRACYAAVRMQRRVSLYADEVQRGGGTPVQIRVGLNSGEVVVRSIGSDLHMDYTAVGQTTHLAARMEQMAKPGSALVTDDTLKLAEGLVQVRSLGAVSVKGIETPMAVYELTGIVPARSRFRASAARGLTRFVGREGELQQLAHAVERAAAGHGQAVAIVGEAGVGKSRLVWEFARSHRTHGWLVLESGSVSYGKATPYLPVIELLKAYCRIQERDDQREIRERVAGKLLMLDRALEPLLTPLLALLDVPVADEGWDALDPPQRRQRTLEAVKRLLLRESQVQPLLVIFEDLHWIDSETQALLDGLIESLPTARVLLLVNYRPEYQHAWGGKTYYLQLRIDPLPPASAEELLNALLGQDEALESLKRVLLERTEGNPFFLEESVQSLVETKVLVGERGACRMAKAPGLLQIPATAQALLAARIDRLTPEDKRLLQAASVIGKDVPFGLLQAIAETPEDGLRQGLTHLQAAEFLYETSLFPDLEYTFKHALTHEVAYASVLQERRRTLHARIVDAIERLYADRLTENVEQLAHHAVRGELWRRAVTYLHQAGTKAAQRSANREAIPYFEQALKVVQHLPDAQETVQEAIDIRFELRNSLFPLGELDKLSECIREAERLATSIGDQLRLGWVSIYTSHYCWITGRSEEARAAGEKAYALAEDLRDFPLQVASSYYLGTACHAIGEHHRSEAFLLRVVELLKDRLPRERFRLAGIPGVMARSWLGWSLAEQGKFEEAIARGEEAMRIGDELDHPYSLSLACFILSYVHVLRGDAPECIGLCQRALSLAREWHLAFFAPVFAWTLGYGYALAGRMREGREVLESSVASLAAMQFGAYHTLMTVHLGELRLWAGEIEKALADAELARASARERHQLGWEAYALRLLGEAHSLTARAESPQRSEGFYREALTLAQAQEMRPLVAHCHLGLGKLYRRTGKHQEAHEHLNTATTMYREMGMGFWLAQAEAALKEPGRRAGR